MSKSATITNANTGKPSPFAAAMSVPARAAAAEDDNDRKPKEGESDEDFAKRMKADKDCPDAEKQKDGESDEDYAKRMRKAGSAEEEEEEVAEPTDDEKKAAAFRDGFQACNSRWETVLKSPEAAGKGAIACELLAGTKLTAKRIVASLSAITVGATSPAPTGLAARMGAERTDAPSPGASVPAPREAGAPITGAEVVAAAKKARGEK